MSLLSVLLVHSIILLVFIIILFYIFMYVRKNEDKNQIFLTYLLMLLLLFILYITVYYDEITYLFKIIYYISNCLVRSDYESFKFISYNTIKHVNKIHDIKVCNDIIIKDFQEINKFYKSPVIFVCNYVNDPLEYFNVGLLDNIVLVARDFSQTKYGYMAESIFNDENYIPVKLGESNYDKLKKQIEKRIKTKSIYIYPEEVEGRGGYKIAKFKTGIFKISSELNIPIVPIVWDHFQTEYSCFSEKNI